MFIYITKLKQVTPPTMRLIGILLLITFFQLGSKKLNAQSHKEDVVYLENGSVYRGKLLGNYPDSTIAIQIIGGSIIVIAKNDIISTAREEAFDPYDIIYSPRDKGYTIFTSIGLLIGTDNWGYSGGVFVDMIHGYHFNEQVQAGIGTLIEASDGFYLALYLDGRFNVKKGKNSPFFYGDIGIYTPLIYKDNADVEDIDPGMNMGLGFGLRFNSKRSQTGFIVSLGYIRSAYSITQADRWDDQLATYSYTKNKAIFKIGLVW